MKNVNEKCFDVTRVNSSYISNRWNYSQENVWFRNFHTSNLKWKNGILKTVKFLEEFGLLRKGVSEIIKIEAKEQKGGFLSMLLITLGASLLGNPLPDKEGKRSKIPEKGVIRAG